MKKIVIISSIIALIAIVSVGALLYRFLTPQNNNTNMENSSAQQNQNTVQPPASQNQEQTNSPLEGNLEVEFEEKGNAGLSICMDKCGDGVCQASNTSCEDGNLNCICVENKTECPEDCSQ